MCRNIKNLHNFDPPVTASEVRASALQYVRKISGTTAPSQANRAAFEAAVDAVAAATQALLDQLVTRAPSRSREQEALRARERGRKRDERAREKPRVLATTTSPSEEIVARTPSAKRAQSSD